MNPIPLPQRNCDGSYGFTAGMQICADGANGLSSPPAYAPKGMPSLDFLENAGGPGNWYGIVCERNGTPAIQTLSDPCPGAFVSPTAYKFSGKQDRDPRAYLDAFSVPYFVIPSHWRMAAVGVVMGCRGTITDTNTGKTLECVVGELGPKGKTGEASMAAARFFGINDNPKNGGTEEHRFRYQFWPGVSAIVDGHKYELIPA